MKKACCNWCLCQIKVEDTYNPQIHRRYCSVTCIAMDSMFEQWQSDEEYNRKRHYQEMTRGQNGYQSDD